MKPAALLLIAACGAATAPPAHVPANATASCREAAAGLEQGTRSVRAPESSVVIEMHARCTEDVWPVAAIECFARMHEGELGRCARALPDGARDRMFAVLGGGAPDRAAIAIARARLESMQVGVGECDRFVAAVHSVLTCEQMPIEARVQLGNETADIWDLPTEGLPEDAQRRMADACGASLAQLQQQAQDAGCML
ncbi:MAG: hypothetical protein ACM31C_03910 [Acidobacteriota bacterium]